MKKLVFIAVLVGGLSITSVAAAGGLSFSLGFSSGPDIIIVDRHVSFGHPGRFGAAHLYRDYYMRPHRHYPYRSYRYNYPRYYDRGLTFRFFFGDRHDYGRYGDRYRHRPYRLHRHYYTP